MPLSLDMLLVKKSRNLSGVGGIFPYHSEYFPHAENMELLPLRSLTERAIFEDLFL